MNWLGGWPRARVAAVTGYGLGAALAAVVVVGSALRLAEAVLFDATPARISPLAAIELQPGLRLTGPPVIAATAEARVAAMTPTNDDWNAQLRDPAFWAGRRGGNSGGIRPLKSIDRIEYQRNGLTKAPPGYFDMLNGRRSVASDDDGGLRGGTTFRTMCVRLCDGFYWPLSFSTTRDQFERDASKCESSCGGGGARLFVYRNPGGEIDEMEDLKGQPYRKLPAAFVFRTKYDAACRCQPQPWEEASLQRHRVYALEAQAQKGNKQAWHELEQLRTVAKAQAIETEKTARLARQANAAGAAGKARTAAAAADAAAGSSAQRGDAAAQMPAGGRTPGVTTDAGRRQTVVQAEIAARPPPIAGDGVVIMRLGSRPPISVQPAASQRRSERLGGAIR